MKHVSHRFSWAGSVMLGIVLTILCSGISYYWYRQVRVVAWVALADDVEELAALIKRIDETCEIIGVAHDRSYIDFLHIGSFSGSQVGPLQLRYPAKWAGPYLAHNKVAQNKLYELLRIDGGYAIAPGQGVKLPHGKVMGVDILLLPGMDIDPYLTEAMGLEYAKRTLVAKVQFRQAKVTVENSVRLTQST